MNNILNILFDIFYYIDDIIRFMNYDLNYIENIKII